MQRLKIIALEPDDVPVIAAHVQDAVFGVSDIDYSATGRRLVALLNRYTWEGAGETDGAGERRRAALRIDRVLRVRSTGFDRAAKSTILSLLTIEFKPDEKAPPSGTLTIVCAANASIQLDVECIEIVLEDLGQAWQAQRRPAHPDESGS